MPRKTYKEPRGYYARKYGRSLTTIQKWINEGAPLDNPKAMDRYVRDKDEAYKAPTGPDGKKIKRGPGRPKDPPGPPPGEQLVGGKTQYQLKSEELEIKVARARHAFEVEKGNYIERDREREAGIVLATELEAELKRIQQELPSKCAGLDEADLLVKIKEYHDRLVHNLKEKLAKLNLGEEEDEE